MKKILAIFNLTETPWHILTFATNIAKERSAPVHGFFLIEPIARPEFSYPFPNDLSLTEGKHDDETIVKENSELMNDNIKLFTDECNAAGISYKIYKNVSINQLIDQTSDADIIIANTKSNILKKLLQM